MKEILKKLAEVKKKNISLVRDTKAFNYKYATLDQMQEKLNPVLEELWLVVYHSVIDWSVFTFVTDVETGEEIHSSIEIKTDKAQDRWSEITYYRRYNLVCLFDLEVEDDDWKKANDSKKKTKVDSVMDDIPVVWKELPRFNDKQLEEFKKVKDNYMSYLEAMEAIETKYRTSKEMRQKVKDLFE